jgi:hypothetical protein
MVGVRRREVLGLFGAAAAWPVAVEPAALRQHLPRAKASFDADQSTGWSAGYTYNMQKTCNPSCPNCEKRMRLTGTFRRRGLPPLKTYRCARCSIAFTEADTGQSSIVQRAKVLLEETCWPLQ